ncbi:MULTISPECIES: phage baseplate assembly protein V [Klebsiella]|uniref:phage baseplate assembly protein V n=1 Tax=Klebsiella TaxID=570 RepID=UPI00066E882A|nr:MULTISPECIES: phage baseplate assembly protein V [Klebsiella]EKU7498722.1 phage baseplate assembly protein [Klebsiella oxytoca]KMV85329.1 phage baseplate assembly protein V [Klebsiella oxytoca 09-7231]STV49893.1 Mu-like prophage protein gp45 [Klebsiella pneumoniae]SXS94867.1 Mu-like prophage protein gp45 [Klebsiella pneumoniae]SXU27888.1 Mu-like prophage protein gp45 [Klebsiella pneumoniae]
MWNQVDLRIRAALRGIRLAFRGRLTRVKSDLSIQQVQVNGLAGEKLQDAELFQHFGFTSCPPAGTQCIVLPIGGQTSHSIIIATENGAYRLQVASGEMAIYSDEGAYVHIKKGRIVETECDEYLVKTKKYTVQAEDYDVTATTGANFETPLLKASDQLADGKSTLEAIRETYDDHDHDHGGDAGTTDKPNQQM